MCGLFNTGIGPVVVFFGFVGQLGDIIDYELDDAEKKRIMIIEPDETNRALFQNLLHERYIVETAATVEEAFMDAAIHTPDLILVDIDAHGGAHAESVKYIKHSPFVGDVEVLVMTSNRSTTAIIQAFNYGANDYILKTDFTKQILVGKIERAFGRTPVLKEANAVIS